jgi:thiaminase
VWLRQDRLVLSEYARVFALAAARVVDVETRAGFAEQTRATLEDELSQHRTYTDEFGISEGELSAERVLPTRQVQSSPGLRPGRRIPSSLPADGIRMSVRTTSGT